MTNHNILLLCCFIIVAVATFLLFESPKLPPAPPHSQILPKYTPKAQLRAQSKLVETGGPPKIWGA